VNDTTKTYPRTLREAFPNDPSPLPPDKANALDLAAMFVAGMVFGLMLGTYFA
jgi:F0F1-type ATP synthase assembly protein I